MTPDRLYHFTCRDGHKRIGRYNCVLLPLSIWRVVWLTTEAEPDFAGTGLAPFDGDRSSLKCDRTEFRYVVTDLAACTPWLGSARRDGVSAALVQVLESYGDPEHWWIANGPVRAVWDRSWAREAVPS